MNEKWLFFLKGLKRLMTFAACILLILALTNVFGFWLLELDLAYFDGTRFRPDTYIGRALSLSLIGFMNSILYIGIASFVSALLYLNYLFILAVGGYTYPKN